jgi:hydrogenase-4 component F
MSAAAVLAAPATAPPPGAPKAAARGLLWLLWGTALVGAAGALLLAFFLPPEPILLLRKYLVIDPTVRLFLLVVNVIFLGITAYVTHQARTVPELRAGIGRFAALAVVFMVAGDLAILSNHLLVMWLCLEATTLAVAPLIVREGVVSSLRASWRYFLFSSVGLAFTLLGLLCLARSIEHGGASPSFFLAELAAQVSGPADTWRKLGLMLVFLGYGTKLGLAPMYSWLPETYDEALPPVTALLAAVQFNCAFVGVLRVLQAYRAADQGLVSEELVALGLMSMAVSTFSIIATHNYGRLIAYASINHAGVIAIGLGIGGSASYGLLLYVVSNAFIKATLFLTAGKIEAHYKTKDMREVAGLIKDLPYSGLFLMVGTFALLGLPPFGSFLGELLILSGLIRTGYMIVFVGFCTLLTITFVATGRSIFPMIWGEPKSHVSWPRQTLVEELPKLVFLAALISMGIYMPPPINALFRAVAASLGG